VRNLRIAEGDLPPGLTLFDGGWHAGVVGLVAARMKDRLHRPVVAFAPAAEDELRGSARSIPGLHVRDVLEAVSSRHPGLIDRFGGHAMAAGFEARADKLGALQAFIAARFKDDLDGTPLMPTLLVDGALQARAASPDLIATLERLAPFGAGNAEPRFVFPAQRVAMSGVVGADHVRCVLTGPDGGRLKAIAFRAAGEDLGRALLESRGAALHVAGRMKLDSWQGRDEVQIQIEDAAFAAG